MDPHIASLTLYVLTDGMECRPADLASPLGNLVPGLTYRESLKALGVVQTSLRKVLVK